MQPYYIDPKSRAGVYRYRDRVSTSHVLVYMGGNIQGYRTTGSA